MNPAMSHYEMFTDDLEHIIAHDDVMSKVVLGVYAADMLPISNSVKNVGLIANIDESSSPGQHWIVLFIPHRGMPEFFDPLGYKPSFYLPHFENFLVNRGPRYKYNTQKIQSDDSSNCGLFCIYFLYLRSRDVTFQNILNTFSIHNNENDNKIITFLRKFLFK